MNSKKPHARNFRLYCVVDRDRAHYLLGNGSDAIQLRVKNLPSYELVKTAKPMARLSKRLGKAFLVNDRIDAALASGSSGVHLGAGDLSVKRARRIMGRGAVVGKTVHSVAEAKASRREECDYVSAGSIFRSPTKRHLGQKGLKFLRQIKRAVKKPLLAIGGINGKNAKAVLEAGADGISVLSAVSEIKKLKKAVK